MVQSYFSLAVSFFFFNDTATTEIYTLSLHDALPIYLALGEVQTREPDVILLDLYLRGGMNGPEFLDLYRRRGGNAKVIRSEEHTSELQSQSNLVCRLLLEKKKKKKKRYKERQQNM